MKAKAICTKPVNTITGRSLPAVWRLSSGRKRRSVLIWHGGQLQAEEMTVGTQEIP